MNLFFKINEGSLFVNPYLGDSQLDDVHAVSSQLPIMRTVVGLWVHTKLATQFSSELILRCFL